MLFPPIAAAAATTCLLVDDTTRTDRLPVVQWVGAVGANESGAGLLGVAGGSGGVALLHEHAYGAFERPSLRGHRLADPTGDPRDVGGRAWTTAFRPERSEATESRMALEARDETAGLLLRTEVESLPGGALRARHSLTNVAPMPYLLEGLEVTIPLPASHLEILDFTGRHERERSPQRHPVNDGLWVRESRRGKPGLDSASVLTVGTPGFTFSSGEVITVSVATSGNSLIAVQRGEAAEATISAGELLLPGEIALLEGHTYTTPWVVVAASSSGLDDAAAALHVWQRSLASHPVRQPVTLNVWEAVYFDHDGERLERIAELAASVGVERFVLDDGWFLGRRDDTAGLGDWWVDETVWPQGLSRLSDRVHELGMEFGLWFEPEMVNPDSDLYRAHPDWVLAAEGRVPLQHRNQLVLDLTNPDAWTYVRDRMDAILTDHDVDYVKWDHNRDLLEAGSSAHGGAPAVHAQNQAYTGLLDVLRAGHPRICWESCAAGGGRIDLGVIERVQRFWTSDMTDALARQQIQRWTVQLVAPEYLGAHVSAPRSHQTGRTFSLDFRAATAFFLAFGIEWDLTEATDAELKELAAWCELHKQFRPLLHRGRVVRIDTTDDAVLAHGVLDEDGSAAILCHIQLDESTHNRGCTLRIPGLSPEALYDVGWIGPTDLTATSMSPPLPRHGPTGGVPVTGHQIAAIGLWIPRRPPETAQLIKLTRKDLA
jgi:alpha-galactosidase